MREPLGLSGKAYLKTMYIAYWLGLVGFALFAVTSTLFPSAREKSWWFLLAPIFAFAMMVFSFFVNRRRLKRRAIIK